MNIIFMGTPDFAVGTLEALIEAGHTIDLVVTQPDKPKGRGNAMAYSAVKEAALKANLPIYQPRRIRDEESVEYLLGFQPDMIVVVAFGQILPKKILDLPKYCCVNVHASLLPKYRGAAPIQWAVINGEEVSGVTTMRMDEGLDTGDMIRKEEVRLDPEETGGSLFDRLALVGAKLCVDTLADIENGSAVYTPQNHEEASHTSIIKKQLGQMDFHQGAKELEQLIRGLNPWPSAFTSFAGKTLKVWKASVPDTKEALKLLAGDSLNEAEALENMGFEDVSAMDDIVDGTILGATKKQILVKTGEGILALEEVQLEGKKRMEVSAFLLGNPVEAGMQLGITDDRK